MIIIFQCCYNRNRLCCENVHHACVLIVTKVTKSKEREKSKNLEVEKKIFEKIIRDLIIEVNTIRKCIKKKKKENKKKEKENKNLKDENKRMKKMADGMKVSCENKIQAKEVEIEKLQKI